MFASIFILILLLPAVCLPLTLNTFFSSSELGEMGISLESSDDTFPMQGYELVDLLPTSFNCEVWEIHETCQVYQ
jgi:hypothetical protein